MVGKSLINYVITNSGVNWYSFSLWVCHMSNFRVSVIQHWNQVGSTWSRFVRVIQVRPASNIIQVWSGLDHVRCEIKKYMIWKCYLFGVCICMQQSPFTVCTESHPLIHCCWKTPRVLSLQYAREYFLQQTYSLHKSTSTFTNHIPVLANLQTTLPLRYLHLLPCICIL